MIEITRSELHLLSCGITVPKYVWYRDVRMRLEIERVERVREVPVKKVMGKVRKSEPPRK